MKKARYTEEQIAFALRQAEAGTAVAEVIRKMGISWWPTITATTAGQSHRRGGAAYRPLRLSSHLRHQRAWLVKLRPAAGGERGGSVGAVSGSPPRTGAGSRRLSQLPLLPSPEPEPLP